MNRRRAVRSHRVLISIEEQNYLLMRAALMRLTPGGGVPHGAQSAYVNAVLSKHFASKQETIDVQQPT